MLQDLVNMLHKVGSNMMKCLLDKVGPHSSDHVGLHTDRQVGLKGGRQSLYIEELWLHLKQVSRSAHLSVGDSVGKCN